MDRCSSGVCNRPNRFFHNASISIRSAFSLIGVRQHFSFALCVYDTPFALSAVTQDGYTYNYPPLVLPGRGQSIEGVRADNALIETVKPAEEGSGVVLRLWEYRGARARVTLHLPKPLTVCGCSMDEREQTPLAVADTYTFDLPPFGIKTLLLR